MGTVVTYAVPGQASAEEDFFFDGHRDTLKGAWQGGRRDACGYRVTDNVDGCVAGGDGLNSENKS